MFCGEIEYQNFFVAKYTLSRPLQNFLFYFRKSNGLFIQRKISGGGPLMRSYILVDIQWCGVVVAKMDPGQSLRHLPWIHQYSKLCGVVLLYLMIDSKLKMLGHHWMHMIKVRLCLRSLSHIQSNFNGSNIFGTIEICSRHG